MLNKVSKNTVTVTLLTNGDKKIPSVWQDIYIKILTGEVTPSNNTFERPLGSVRYPIDVSFLPLIDRMPIEGQDAPAVTRLKGLGVSASLNGTSPVDNSALGSGPGIDTWTSAVFETPSPINQFDLWMTCFDLSYIGAVVIDCLSSVSLFLAWHKVHGGNFNLLFKSFSNFFFCILFVLEKLSFENLCNYFW